MDVSGVGAASCFRRVRACIVSGGLRGMLSIRDQLAQPVCRWMGSCVWLWCDRSVNVVEVSATAAAAAAAAAATAAAAAAAVLFCSVV